LIHTVFVAAMAAFCAREHGEMPLLARLCLQRMKGTRIALPVPLALGALPRLR
jgi:hypothetical protein